MSTENLKVVAPRWTLTVACPRECGKLLIIPEPGRLSGPPRPNPIARWWRRRTIRLWHARATYQFGRDIENALVAHYVLSCPVAAAEDEAEDEPTP